MGTASLSAGRPEPRCAEGSETGTTLVELLVSMALLSLIALFALQGIGSLRRVALVEARIVDAEEIVAVAGHLRRTLREAATELPDGSQAGFRGESGGMRFQAPADPFLEVGGLVTVTIAAQEERAGRFALVERRSPSRVAGDDERDTVTLLRDLAAVRFAYARANADGTLAWTADWADPTLAAPTLVRIVAERPAGGHGATLDVLVHLALHRPAPPAAGPPEEPPPPSRSDPPAEGPDARRQPPGTEK